MFLAADVEIYMLVQGPLSEFLSVCVFTASMHAEAIARSVQS